MATTWFCLDCTFDNSKYSTICKMCLKSKKTKNKWSCLYCTLDNDIKYTKCQVCNKKKETKVRETKVMTFKFCICGERLTRDQFKCFICERLFKHQDYIKIKFGLKKLHLGDLLTKPSKHKSDLYGFSNHLTSSQSDYLLEKLKEIYARPEYDDVTDPLDYIIKIIAKYQASV